MAEIGLKKWTQARKRKSDIIEMLRAGEPRVKIAASIGVHPRTIQVWCKIDQVFGHNFIKAEAQGKGEL